MQSGKANTKMWFLEFETLNNSVNPLMGWESSTDTLSELKLAAKKATNLFLEIEKVIISDVQYLSFKTNDSISETDLTLVSRLSFCFAFFEKLLEIKII